MPTRNSRNPGKTLALPTAPLPTLGWREWIALPKLGEMRIKAKVDTGAKTSCLHTFQIERFRKRGADRLRFFIHPYQNDEDTVLECQAPLRDMREVSDSGGHKEQRYVIETEFCVGSAKIGYQSFDAELTLTDRDTMRFRMLLGRNALANRFIIDPALSFLLGGDNRSAP